uniref:Ionotropic glutamate receptor L-glutamate and glycine-binding domain-containing protein n=1 Tax=Strigamia maritima TaxID=126957 RepID=T1IWG1_STRMM
MRTLKPLISNFMTFCADNTAIEKYTEDVQRGSVFGVRSVICVSFTAANLYQNCPRITLLISNLQKDMFSKKNFEVEFKYLGNRWFTKKGNNVVTIMCTDQIILAKNNFSKAIKVSAKALPPRILLTSKNKKWIMEGYCGHLFSIFQNKFNISFEMLKTESGSFGSLKRGKWTGMMGDVVHGTADIAACLSATRKRKDYVDFSQSLYTIDFEILYRKLDYREWPFTYFLKAFSKNVWLSIFGINLIIIFIVQFVTCTFFTASIVELIYNILLCWPIVLLGDLPFSSIRSMKFCLIFYMMSSMMLLSVYTSLLTALFATSKTKIPFYSLEEMIYNTDYLPVILTSSAIEEYFVRSFKNEPFINATTVKSGVEFVYREKTGLIITTGIAAKYIDKNCSFTFAPYPIYSENVALAFSKRFEHKKFFNH